MIEWIEAFFAQIPPMVLIVGSTVGAFVMGIFAIIVRSKAAHRPVSVKSIVLPPIFMSSGALMFLFEAFRVPFLQIIEAVAVGFLFSLILIKTSHFEIRNESIYLKRSKVFILILLGLLLIRLIGKFILSSTIDLPELGGMFWLLAFGMIVPWRFAMLKQFIALQKQIKKSTVN